MPKGPRKFQFLLGATGLTRFGGLSLFSQFCKSLRLRYLLQHYIRWPAYNHRAYHPADLFMAHIFAIVSGIGRIENTLTLVHNGLIPPLLGLPEFPHRDTLRTFLWRFDKKRLRSLEAVHDRLRRELFQRLGLLYSATVDCDTTTLTVFGHQESVEVGYNRKYRGKRSYAPIISSEGKSGLSLGMELRSGNIDANVGALIFLNQMLEKLPSSIASSRIRLRLDGAFYDKDTIRVLDEKGLGYVIVATMTPSLKREMIAARYHEFAKGWEAAEFDYPIASLKKKHRFVAIRRPVAAEPTEILGRFYTFKRYAYHRALVTGNLDLTPESVWRLYTDRACQELLLREFKDSFFMAKIPTRSFWANSVYMEMILWAYDLALAFQILCLPKEFQAWNIATLRRELWWIPANWIKRGSRNVLLLPAKYPHRELLVKIQKAASKVKPLI